jgi:hypothetical protein
MSSLMIGCIVFGCILGATIIGTVLRRLLPAHQLCPETRDVIKMGMGLIGTMTALVLGLLIASAKSSFDTQRNGLAQMSANVILLDRFLARYGPESKDVRQSLQAAVSDLLERTWPAESSSSASKTPSDTAGRYEGMYDKIQELVPKNENQRSSQAQAMKAATDIGQMRWLLFSHKGSSIPGPFLVVMVCWLALILASFSLLAPRNATAFLTLMVCALAVSSAIFLILELDQPFNGIVQISSAPLRNALGQLGR